MPTRSRISSHPVKNNATNGAATRPPLLKNDHIGETGNRHASPLVQDAIVPPISHTSFSPQDTVIEIRGAAHPQTPNQPASAPKAESAFTLPFKDCLAAAMDQVSEMPPAEPRFWNELGLWESRIIEEMQSLDWMATKLSRYDRTFLDAVAEWLDITVEKPTIALLAQKLSKEALATGERWAKTLFLVDALVHNRSHQAIDQIGAHLLSQHITESLAAASLSPRSKRLLIALHIYANNPSDLELMLLYERSERYRYNRYVIHTHSSGQGQIAAPQPGTLRHPSQILPEEANRSRAAAENHIGSITVDLVNQALVTFEAGRRGGRHSRCLHVLHDSDGRAVVFIRRVLRQRSIAELDQTIFGDEAETIVLKFRHDMHVIEERSTEQIGVFIAQEIAHLCLGTEVAYVQDNTFSETPDVKRLFSTLRQGDDPALTLVEVHLASAPLPGSPLMMLRGSQAHPIGQAIDTLADKGLDLVQQVEDIHQIGIGFLGEHSGNPFTYIFKVRFEKGAGEQIRLSYFTAQSSSIICQKFESHMRENHDIRVLPAAR